MWLLITAFAAWTVSQLIKFAIRGLHGQPDLRLFYRSGGMPSAHAATVTALAVAALTTEGLMSPVSGIAIVFAAIVIYDTLGVRRVSGEQSIMINTLSRMVGNTKQVREVLGHTPREVVVGIGVGAVVGLGFTYTAWAEHAEWLVVTPDTTETWVYLALFTAITVMAIAVRLWLGRWLRGVAIVRTLKGAVGWSGLLPGLLGLFFVFAQFQAFGPVTWRLWPLLVLAGFILTQAVLIAQLYIHAKQIYRVEAEELLQKRKQKTKQRKRTKKATRKRRKTT